MSRSRSSGSRSDSCALSVSIPALSVSWKATSFWTAIESAGRHGAIAASNRKNSGAPRPSASSCTTRIQAFTPAE
jgi:hypothetical protein